MKKHILKSFILLLFSSFLFVACEEDEVVKEDYEGGDESQLPELTVDVSDVTFESANASMDIEVIGDSEFIEKGLIISTDESFYSSEEIITLGSDENSASLELSGSTDYYVKAYSISENGVAHSEPASFTTPEAPSFEDTFLFGTYTQTDYDFNGQVDGVYEEAVKFVERPGSANRMDIENFWDGGETITAVVDFENKTFTIEPQVIYVDPEHGDCYIYHFFEGDDGWSYDSEELISGSYDENGNVSIDAWGAGVEAGFFGQYSRSELEKVD